MSVEYQAGYSIGYNNAYDGVMKIIEDKTHITEELLDKLQSKDTALDGWCLALSEVLNACKIMHHEHFCK